MRMQNANKAAAATTWSNGTGRRPQSEPKTRLVLLLALAGLDEGLVDVRDDTTTSDGGLDECVQLLVTTDGQLQVTRRDALHLEILAAHTQAKPKKKKNKYTHRA